MESWLKESGAVGLEDLELVEFPVTGRGARALRPFKQGERILTIPGDCLWTVEHAYADPLLGPVLCSTQPPLSVEDTLAIHLLFVRSRESGHDRASLDMMAHEVMWRRYPRATLQASSLRRTNWKFAPGLHYIPSRSN
ncbi:hypothetical protein J3E69DRAFT_24096 [Trichoderma sp. SZMC 28015]